MGASGRKFSPAGLCCRLLGPAGGWMCGVPRADETHETHFISKLPPRRLPFENLSLVNCPIRNERKRRIGLHVLDPILYTQEFRAAEILFYLHKLSARAEIGILSTQCFVY